MKKRLSASIDEDLLAAAEAAVREGYAPSMSALVEDAMREAVAKQQRRSALGELIDELDAELGYTPTDEEVRADVAQARARAIRPNRPEPRAERQARQSAQSPDRGATRRAT